MALESFDHILNATAARLHLLKDAVESPALTGKIQKLHNAAHSQEKQLKSLEENLQEIREERDSLADIVQNLPKCPQSGHWACARVERKMNYRDCLFLWGIPHILSLSERCWLRSREIVTSDNKRSWREKEKKKSEMTICRPHLTLYCVKGDWTYKWHIKCKSFT